jgi:protoporphyrinogen oxidase
LVIEIKKNGGEIFLSSPVEKIKSEKSKILVRSQKGDMIFDKVIVTIPAPIFVKITPELRNSWKDKIRKISFLSATSLLLVLKKSFIPFYWLNVNEKNFPFLLASEHTNFASRNWYNGEVILYLGNYVGEGNKTLSFSKDEILDYYLPYLKKINPKFEKNWVKKSFYFKAPFAQHVATTQYLKELPGFETPIKNLYLASMFQVYPFDRGMNYAVRMGNEVSKFIS